MDMPLISVIVPVYNVEKYLDRCLQSITEQTYRDLEIILVDDGSPDNSGAICDAWAEKDSRINVIHKTNGGLSDARNVGMDAAQGVWVGFIDSDDYVSINMYQHLLSLADDQTDIVECCWEKTFDDAFTFPKELGNAMAYAAQDAMRMHIADEKFWQIVCNKLYRRKTIGNIHFPKGKINEDEFWTYQVIAVARKLIHSEAVFYAYRQQETSIMNKPYSIRRLDCLEAKLQRWEFLKNKMPELSMDAQEDLILSCLYGMQSVLYSLSGQEQEKAKKMIYHVIHKAVPFLVNPERSGKRKILLYFVQRYLEGTAKFLNFLIKIGILT